MYNFDKKIFKLHLNFVYTTNLYSSGSTTTTCDTGKATGIKKIQTKVSVL